MGTPYSAQTQSGFNLSPPPDDGSVQPSNLATWNADIIGKVGNPLLVLSQGINTALLAALDFSGRVASISLTTLLSDHMQTIECSATITASLVDVATGGAGYIVGFRNTGSGVVTIAMQNPGNTLDGVANGTASIPAGGWAAFKINKAATGYYSYGINSADMVLKQNLVGKDSTGGYVGLTLYKINFNNAANTFTSFFTNSNSAARTYTFQDRNGTIADDTDLALKAPLLSPALTGFPTTPLSAPMTGGNVIASTNYVDNAVALAGTGGINAFPIFNLGLI